MYLDDLLEEMEVGGLISAETSTTIYRSVSEDRSATSDAVQAWYVRFLTGFSAWIAAVLFGVALGIFGLFDNEVVSLIIGGILVVAALFLRRRSNDAQLFQTQLALATSLLGQGMIAFTVIELSDEPSLAAAAAFIVAALLIWFYPDRLHAFLSTLIAAASLYIIVTDQFRDSGPALVNVVLMALIVWLWWQADRRWSWLPARIAIPLSYALPFPLLIALLAVPLWPDQFYWLSSAAAIGLSCFVAQQIVTPMAGQGATFAVMGVAVTVGLLTNSEPGLLMAMLLLTLGFWRGGKMLMLLASVSLLYFMGSFYYRLDITLLNKSFLLMLTGVVLLAAWAGLRSAVRNSAEISTEAA